LETTRTVGRYELVWELGAGGTAVVHLARQGGLDRSVALKERRTFESGGRELALRFVREARVAGQLSHPNLVTVVDFFEGSGTP
jgi:serine/threonine protein kinase